MRKTDRYWIWYGVLFLCLTLFSTSVAASSDLEKCSDQPQADFDKKICKISITKLHLTQYSVGQVAVACKIKQVDDWVEDYLDENKEADNVSALNHFLESDKNHIPLVRGPKGSLGEGFYTTDHHHLGAAVWNSKTFKKLSDKKKAKVNFVGLIKADFKNESWPDFWQKMIDQDKVWPYDNRGERIAQERFKGEFGPYPADFGILYDNDHNDPYRTLSRWVRESCLYLKAGNKQCGDIAKLSGITPKEADFMEFVWANYLRKKLPWPTETNIADENILLSLYSLSPAPVRDPEAKAWLTQHHYNPQDYGYHENGLYLYLNFNKHSCEKSTDHVIAPM
ncbi:MAG: ParB/Srx family N-terminal domain-containing protein [Magnetococcales bacterium]|nr:ParB/Srx family N-terminal domain-containing protein [Magnetococcales bacterium]